MVLQREDFLEAIDEKYAFGFFLTSLRLSSPLRKVKQTEIVSHLPGWSTSSYSRLESGEVAPHFVHLRSLYQAFLKAKVTFSFEARQQFIDLARRRIALQKTHKDVHTDEEWAELRFALTRMEGLLPVEGNTTRLLQPLYAETSHLLGRDQWREDMLAVLQEIPRKKLLVVRGSIGVGKSSELNWLALTLARSAPVQYRSIACDFRSQDRVLEAEEALDMLLGAIFTELGYPSPEVSSFSRDTRVTRAVHVLEHAKLPVALLIDHGECLFQEGSTLAPCWERFFLTFLRSHHRSVLFLATRQWPGWFGGEHLFVAETSLPPLSRDQSILLLQRLGLDAVPVTYLQEVYDRVGGIPLCLEWVAALVKEPLHADDWEVFEESEQEHAARIATKHLFLTQRVEQLLLEPQIFGGSLSDAIAPLLERLVASQRLSREAQDILRHLAVATLPLAKPALIVLCPSGPRPVNELRWASFVVAHPHRVRLLPVVASAVLRRLTAEQIQASERMLINAYTSWLRVGVFSEREKGTVIAELATLQLKHALFLEAAELLIRYGWLAFNAGHAPRLASLAFQALAHADGPMRLEQEAGALLLRYFLSPVLSKQVDERQRMADYQHVLSSRVDGKITLQPQVELYVVRMIMVQLMNDGRFAEAQALLDACEARLASDVVSQVDVQASFLEKQGLLSGTWSEDAEERGDDETEHAMAQRALTIYQRCVALLLAERDEQTSPLESEVLKKRLAKALTNLGFYLSRAHRWKEALQALDQSIDLKEHGYVEPGSLAASYGEKAQVLAHLGHFQEAVHFDERARSVIRQLADAGNTSAQEEMWVYQVDQGRIALLMGHLDEAEQLFEEARDHIHERRRIYRRYAKQGLTQIRQRRQLPPFIAPQIDWRWVERFRELTSFNSFKWLAHAGPFTQDEQQAWDRVSAHVTDEELRQQAETILARSRQREVHLALEEHREPRLHYPAIPLHEVKARIRGLLSLDAEIEHIEPNMLVRDFYHHAIEEQLDFLGLIEACAEENSERFHELNHRLHPEPTPDEMTYTLSRVRAVLKVGQAREMTRELSLHVLRLLREQLHVPCDLDTQDTISETFLQDGFSPSSPPRSTRLVAPHVVKRFFEAVLREYDYEGWTILLDHAAQAPRVENGARQCILPTVPLSIDQVRDYLEHELGGHVSRSVAGERSSFGLLGIGTKGSLATEEGLALYFDWQAALASGKRYDESRNWLGTLATGLAYGVIARPQTFFSLFTFFEPFLFLYRLLWRDDEELQVAREKARTLALNRCLRTYRGVPDPTQAGFCYTKDALYLRGLRMIANAVAHDESMLDRLSIGVVAKDQLSDLEYLGIVASLPPLRKLARDPQIEAYILSFETPQDQSLSDRPN